MPLYEYGCDACGHTLEIQQKLAEAPLRTCPSCGKAELNKIISATSFVLKGGGWYKDGYGSSKEKARTENQRTDKAERAIKDDKAKAGDAAPAAAASTAAAPAAASPASSSDSKPSSS